MKLLRNKLINKILLMFDKFMPEIFLIETDCNAKNLRKRKLQFMTSRTFKDLPKRTSFNEVLLDKAL